MIATSCTRAVKQCQALQIIIHCDLTNTDAHRFFSCLGLTINVFEFYLKNNQLLEITNENSRSLGVGRCLINYMKNVGNTLGIDKLILDSGCERGRAHKFYYREGFIINR
ncbi:unnamed protein product, partial [Rotaria sp. Silwood2]